jgi:hypothetical protein
MGYDAKAVLVPKSIKTMANGDKFFLKLMKTAIEAEVQGKNRRFSDPATSQSNRNKNQQKDN